MHYLSVIEVQKRFQGVCQSAGFTADVLSAELPSVSALIHVEIRQPTTFHIRQLVQNIPNDTEMNRLY